MNHYDFTGIATWDQIKGFFSLAEAIAMQLVVKHLPPNSVLVELGSFQGRSSVAIAAVLPESSVLHCIDFFEGTILSPGQVRPPMEEVVKMNVDAFTKNIEAFGVKDKVKLHISPTTAAAKLFAPESIDLLFIDADHSYEGVVADLQHWYPKLKSGGFLLCDDYEEKWPGVIQAIQTFGLQGRLIAPSLWFHRKEPLQTTPPPDQL